MTTLYLDTEFNGWDGELISIALVGRDYEFYVACKISEKPSVWIAEFVMPKLGIPQVEYSDLRLALHQFLLQVPGPIEVIADWPCDFKYLAHLLVKDHGECLRVPLTMKLVYDIECTPAVRHNALSDARALMSALEGMR